MTTTITPYPLSERINRLGSSPVRELLAFTQNEDIISFAGGLPDDNLIAELSHFAETPQALQYGPSEGEPLLREWIAFRLKSQGLRCQTKQILITSGSQQGLDLIGKLFIDQQTPVALESPTYLAALQVFKIYGAQCLGLPISSQGLDPQALERLIQQHKPAFIYLIPTFQNPTGNCYPAHNRQQIAQIIDRHNICLVEDDPYRELNYSGREERSICSYLTRSPWIYLGSFSKTIQPGLRVGYLACSPQFFEPLRQLKQATDLHSNRLGQKIITEIIQNNSYSQHLHKTRQRYEAKRNAMENALQASWGNLAEWHTPQGGLFYWLKLKQGHNAQDYLPSALRQNIAFLPGNTFFANTPSNCSFLRLNFSHPSTSQIHQGITTLASVFNEKPAAA